MNRVATMGQTSFCPTVPNYARITLDKNPAITEVQCTPFFDAEAIGVQKGILMHKSAGLRAVAAVTTLFVFHFQGFVLAQSSQQIDSVIIATGKPYTKVVSDIQALGGTVKHQYKYVDAVAADVPSSALETLRSLVGSSTISKDLTVPTPASVTVIRASQTGTNVTNAKANSASVLPSIAEASPAAYSINNLGLNIRDLHLQGYTGAGVVVAVIDSGVRPKYPILDKDNSVIGGMDFVGDGIGFSSSRNDPHGTFVSGLISGNAVFSLGNGTLTSSIQTNFPGALNGTDLPLVGTAPSSGIYAVRVFGINPLVGAPESRVIAAIDHVIDVRQKFDRGEKGGFNIQVCNLSLGNTTLAAGRDLFDRSVDALLAAGIVPVVSAGDVGPSGMTVASPATSLSAIAVGGASAAANERVQQDVENGLGYGQRYRPSGATQVGWFSTRGPNADGRISPGVIANAVGNFSQGYGSTNDVSIASGTSFSAPLVAGVAAVLRQAFPAASATQIRNAIIGAGSPISLFSGLDQGSGFPDAGSAASLLGGGNVSGSLPPVSTPQQSVATNVKQGTGLNVVNGSIVESTDSLAPGQRAEILYNISPNTSSVVISLSNFQKTFTGSGNVFPEQIFLQVHSAKTSMIGGTGDYFDIFPNSDPFVTGGTFTVNNPETGIMRITASGSWTNAGNVSGTLSISSSTDSVPSLTTQGQILHHQRIVFPVTVPAGVSRADFRLWFRDDWGAYPTSDVDMILFDPNLNRNTQGAHLNDPENATVLNPTPGTWFVLIDGFDIPAGSDKFELRVSLDGKVVK